MERTHTMHLTLNVKMLTFFLFVCLLQASFQAGYIKVQWNVNEVFLTTGRSLELSVATVNLSLSCSYIPENVTWLHPSGDRISISGGNTLMISILRLAESGNYTCQNSYTGEEVKIELIPTGSGLFEIENRTDIMLSNGYSVIEPIGSSRVFICLTSLQAARWHLPNGSFITNKLILLDDNVTGIAVFYALPNFGVYQLRLNGYFSAEDSGRYQCISENSVEQVETQNIYIYPEGTNYIRAKYEQNSLQLITNSTLDLPVGTSSIQLSCSIPNATWVYPQTPYISELSTNSSVLEISIFTIGEAGYYTCIGSETVVIAINGFGSALIAISGNKSGILFGHEIITHNGLESEILCLSSDSQNIPSVGWYHPTVGRIDTAIYKEDGSIEVEQNVPGVYQLVIKGELSRQDEGVYTCRVVHKNNATTYLTFGLYSDKEFISVSSFPDSSQVYNEQTIAFPQNRESILLSCPFQNAEWERPYNSSSILPDGRVLIETLTSTAEGVYTCRNTAEVGNAISIIILQGTQQLELSIDGEAFNRSSLTINPCDSPRKILCSISNDTRDTPINWYSGYSRAVVSASVNNAVLDTSSLRAEDSGMYICSTDVLGYSIKVELELTVIQANYIQLQNGSRKIAIVNEQTVYLDLLTPAVFLTCKGTLPNWLTYPISNTTRLINSDTLYIDKLNSQAIGEYKCVENSTGEITLIYIAANSDYSSYDVITEQEYHPYYENSSYIQIEHFHTSFFTPSESYPVIKYGTYGVKLSCSLKGYVTWIYPQNTNEVCLVSGGVLIRSINTNTRGAYSCSNSNKRVSISLTNVILVTQMNSSQLITGYSSIQIPLFQPYITISCDSPNNTWLIELSRINSSYLGYGNQRVNGTTINVIDGMLTIGSFGVYESGTYTCDPGTTRQTTIYLQSSGLALFANYSTSPTRIPNNSVFLIPPSSTLPLTCVYGSIHTAPTLSYMSLSNYTSPPTNCVQTELSLITSSLSVYLTAKHINFTDSASIRANTALNGNYACVINQNFLISFTVYHLQTVTPRIKFYRNSSPLQSFAISSFLNNTNDLLECRVNIIEYTIPVDTVEWWLNGSIPVVTGPTLNLSSLQPQYSLYECRAYSRFANASKKIWIEVIGVPLAPTGLVISEITSTNAVLSWLPPVSPRISIQWYLIEYTELSLASESYIALSNSTTVLLAPLTPFTRYNARVRARNVAGYGIFSFSATFRTLQAAPTIPLNSTYSHLTNTSIVLAWVPPRDPDGIIQSYQIDVSGSKSYDPLFEETRNPILVNSSTLQLIIDSLTPDTLYTITIYSLSSMGEYVNTASLRVRTQPGVLDVTSPVIWSTPLRGLKSILILLQETSNTNAEIKYQLLFMLRVQMGYDTETLNIPRLLHNNKRTARDASQPEQVIQLSVIANISTENCNSFPNYITVGDPRGINPCHYSQQQRNMTNFAENIQINYNPELEFNYMYGFILTALTRDEITYYSDISELISLLPEDTVEIELSLIYTIAGVGAGVILFLFIVLLICCVTCSVLSLSSTRKSLPISNRKDSQTLALTTIDTSLTIPKSPLTFFNPLVSTPEEHTHASEALSTFEELARITYCGESEFAISVEGFGEQIKFLHADNNQAFSQEYNRLNERARSEAKSSLLMSHRHLNRFVDIFPYDDSRVVLTPIPDFDHDYINASFIDGYNKERNYIATQAPLLETICDFWRQCWEYNITVITLLTDSIEGSKARNYRYWPDNITTEISFGPFVIRLTDIIIKKNFIRRALLVKNTQYPDESRKINQFHFTSWPDTSMPEISSLLQFHTIVSSFYKSQKQSGPLLVHCRSGAGPSSVYLFLDILQTQARAENRICIQKCINSMRTMRSRILCSLEYYIFAHDVLHASLTCGNTCVDTPSFSHYFKKLAEVDSCTRSTGYHAEYTTLDQISKSPFDYSHTLAYENPTKNRNMDFLPIDSRCVHLSQGAYINATLVNGFARENSYIIAESPLDTTIECFWQLIFEQRCSTIIMLCDLIQEQKEVCAKYWTDSGEPVTYGHLTVQLSNIIHPEHGAYTIHTFVLTSAKIKGSYFEVKQFIYHEWDDNFLPAKLANFVKLITDVINHSSSDERNDPILVHCSDTVGCSGLFCASLYSFERLIAENEVDVFGCVRLLRNDKPGIVPTMTHYKSIYKTILIYLKN